MNEIPTKRPNLEAFAKGLSKLTRQYGVALRVTGGVITDQPEVFEGIEYFTGNNGDLLPHIGDNWL
ncbi:MAG: hypothetical protein HQL76_05855 [Magnetococcales bacterium]|nr:hypothetical protein [Magnetococcales bacterium]